METEAVAGNGRAAISISTFFIANLLILEQFRKIWGGLIATLRLSAAYFGALEPSGPINGD
jgi:hypothetical protein